MKLISAFFKNLHDASERKEQELKDKMRVKELKLSVELDNEQLDMQMKPCPIIKRLCEKECAHFSIGKASVFLYEGELFPVYVSPRCKLWK